MTHPHGPPYIENSAETYPPPWKIDKIRFDGFFIRGDLAKIQAMVDKNLNLGGPIEYRAISSFMLLSFVRLGQLESIAETFAEHGWFSENEVDLWVFLVAGTQQGELFVAERLVWWVPFLCVDSGLAMVTGREVYGFPKRLGSFQLPTDWDRPDRFVASSHVVENWGPGAKLSMEEIVEVRRVGPVNGSGFKQVWTTFAEAAVELMKIVLGREGPVILPGLGVAEDALRHLILREQRLVFLKQFRDADCSMACYQAIVEAPIRFTKIRNVSLLSDTYRVWIPHFDSLKLNASYGLQANGPEGQAVDAAFRAFFDFTLEPGTVIYETT